MYLVIQELFPEGSKRILGLYSSQTNAQMAIDQYKKWCRDKGYSNADHDTFSWIKLSVNMEEAEWIKFG